MIKQTSYERKYQERLQFAMSNLRISHEIGMYAVVPSTSDNGIHIVDIDEHTLYSRSCDCKAAENNMDCLHRLAVDRYLDEQRDALKVTANVTVEQDYTVDSPVAEVMADADTTMRIEEQQELAANDKTYAEAVGFAGDPRIELVNPKTGMTDEQFQAWRNFEMTIG